MKIVGLFALLLAITNTPSLGQSYTVDYDIELDVDDECNGYQTLKVIDVSKYNADGKISNSIIKPTRIEITVEYIIPNAYPRNPNESTSVYIYGTWTFSHYLTECEETTGEYTNMPRWPDSSCEISAMVTAKLGKNAPAPDALIVKNGFGEEVAYFCEGQAIYLSAHNSDGTLASADRFVWSWKFSSESSYDHDNDWTTSGPTTSFNPYRLRNGGVGKFNFLVYPENDCGGDFVSGGITTKDNITVEELFESPTVQINDLKCPDDTEGSILFEHSATPSVDFVYTIVQYVANDPDALGDELTQQMIDSNPYACDATFGKPVLPSDKKYYQLYGGNFKSRKKEVLMTSGVLMEDLETEDELYLSFVPGFYEIQIEQVSHTCVCKYFFEIKDYDDESKPSIAVNSTAPSCVSGNNGNINFVIDELRKNYSSNTGVNYTIRAEENGELVYSSQDRPDEEGNFYLPTSVASTLILGHEYYLKVEDGCTEDPIISSLAIPQGTNRMQVSVTETNPPSCADGVISVEIINSELIMGNSLPTYSYSLISSLGTNDNRTNPTSGQGTTNATFENLIPSAVYTAKVISTLNCETENPTQDYAQITGIPSITMKASTPPAYCSDVSSGAFDIGFSSSRSEGNVDFNLKIEKSGTGYTTTNTNYTTLDTINLSNLPKGVYTVSFTDNCNLETSSLTRTVSIPDTISISLGGSDPILCYNGSEASQAFTINGGTPPFQVSVTNNRTNEVEYSWSSTEKRTYSKSDIDSLSRGQHTISVTETGGSCSDSESKTFTVTRKNNVSSVISVNSMIKTDVTCKNAGDGKIKVFVSGGVPGYTVKLQKVGGGKLTADSTKINTYYEYYFDSLDIGTYYPLIEDANECDLPDFSNTTRIIREPNLLIVSAIDEDDFSGNTVSTYNSNLYVWCHDSIAIFSPASGTITGGTTPYSYKLGSASFSGSKNIAISGQSISKTFYVTDANECTANQSFTVKNPSQLSLDVIDSSSWSHGASVACYDDLSEGKIRADATGGIPMGSAYSYEIVGDPGSAISVDHKVFTGLTVGQTYTIKATDRLGCFVNESDSLFAPTATAINHVSPSKYNGYEIACRNGDIDVVFNASGGTGKDYEMRLRETGTSAWSNAGFATAASTSTTVDDITAGNYQYQVMDSYQCWSPLSNLSLDEPGLLTLTATNTAVPICIQGEDGVITVTASGGVRTSERNFKIGTNTTNYAELKTGAGTSYARPASDDGYNSKTYYLKVTDKNGCIATDTATVHPNSNPLTIAITDSISPSCHMGTDGFIEFQVTNATVDVDGTVTVYLKGGHIADSLEWIGSPDTVGHFTGLHDTNETGTPTPYEIVVYDDNGCKIVSDNIVDEIYLHSPPPLVFDRITWNRPTIEDFNDGWIRVAVSGGTGSGYQVSMDGINFIDINHPSEDQHLFSDLYSGDYAIYLRDDNFVVGQEDYCIVVSDTTTLGEGRRLDLSSTSIQRVSCNDAGDGSIQLVVKDEFTGDVIDTDLSVDYEVVGKEGSQTSLNITGGSIPEITNLDGGTYYFTVTYRPDSLPTDTAAVIRELFAVVEPDSLSFSYFHPINPPCSKDVVVGKLQFQVAGGHADEPVYYSLNGGAAIQVDKDRDFMEIANLDLKNHEIVLSKQDGSCTASRAFTIANESLSASLISKSNPTCHGVNDGWIEISSDITGVDFLIAEYPLYSSKFGKYDTLGAGIYHLVITKSGNATCLNDTLEVTLTQPDVLSLSVKTNNANCGQNDGSAEVVTLGGTPSYTTIWRDKNLQPVDQERLSAGDYTVKVTDSLGCSITSEVFTIGDVPGITVSVDTISPANCLINDGSLDLTINGGVGPYLVNNTEFIYNQLTLDSLFAGDTLIGIVDARGCDLSTLVTVPSQNTLQLVLDTAYATTCGVMNGAAKIMASGGKTPYSFNWGDTITTIDSLSGMDVGSYHVTVTDGNGCQQSLNLTIGTTDGIQNASVELIHPFCELTNGSMALSGITGEFPPFQVKLLNTSDTLDLGSIDQGDSLVVDSLGAGTYDFLLYDANQCLFKVNDVVLTDDPGKIPEYSWNLMNESSCGLGTGNIEVVSLTGQAPYSYRWEQDDEDLGITTSSHASLSAGVYHIYVTDTTGCEVEVTATMSDRPLPEIELLSTQSSPYAAANGALEVGLTGGVGSYLYQLDSTENSTGYFGSLAPGNYQVSGADSLGCRSDTLSVSILGTSPLNISFDGATAATCLSAANGSVLVSASGGLSPYIFVLGNDTVSTTIVGLSAGSYYVLVSDSIGSVDSVSVTVPVLDSLIVTGNVSLVSCEDGCDGEISLTLDGGSGSYSVSWEDGSSGSNLSNLCPGSYSYTITDNESGDCILTGSETISEQPYLGLEVVSIVAPSCFNGDDGSIAVSGTGGSGAYTYSWDTGDTGSLFDDQSPGEYVVTVFDNLLGCTFQDTLTIPNTAEIAVSDTTIFQPTCLGSFDGYITLTVANANNPLIEWDRGDFGRTIRNVSAGTYGFQITSNLGCVITGEVAVEDRNPLAVETSSTNNVCFGYCEGQISLTISGGTAPYFVEWNNGNRSRNRTGLCAGTYTYTVKDGYQCAVAGSVTIEQPDLLAIELTAKENVSCYQESNGSIQVTVTGGTGTYAYDWSSGDTTSLASGLVAGSYSVDVSDENGCVATASYQITQPDFLSVSNSEVINPLCSGAADGSATITPEGGTAPYEILWANDQTQFEATGLAAGVHNYTISDAKGCTYSNSVRLVDPPGMQIANVVLNDPICYNDTNGDIYFEVIGGSGNYEYDWSMDIDSANEVGYLGYGNYTVTVQDINGCSLTRTFTLDNPAELFVSGVPDYVLMCSGGESILEPDGSWESYQWSGPDGDLGTESRLVVSEEGEYLLEVEDEDHCPADMDILVEVSDNALVADFIRVSEAVVFEPVVIIDLSTPLPDNVNWVLPDTENMAVNQNDEAILELVFTEPGDYEVGVEVTLSNCASQLYKTITISEEPEESNNRNSEPIADDVEVKMFPNPTRGEFKVFLDAPTDDKFSVQLVNMNKNIIEERIFQGKSNYIFDWNFSSSPSGVYFLVIQYGDNVQSKRILVLK